VGGGKGNSQQKNEDPELSVNDARPISPQDEKNDADHGPDTQKNVGDNEGEGRQEGGSTSATETGEQDAELHRGDAGSRGALKRRSVSTGSP
jgi:hypothetical protein